MNRLSARAGRSFCAAVIAALAVAAAGAWLVDRQPAQAAKEKGTASMMLAHNVYFSLQEPTPENRQKLIDACHKYLADHPGVVFYAAGVVSDLDRPVNDRDFDVGLHVIFADRSAHDAYQTAPTHLQFIEENKHLWAKVRVFDSDVSQPGS